ncbi:MFS transporter [Phycicoccus sp. Soil802]|uniref:MFS transporter n=1 Tax=Phycicoccus sp. Soil802 TaxID=1736414 RepID=UPI000702BC07|nr:MFS transporter [Phycicoccus sp. Soil802]KRF28418.1 hypothetical protein ASG91_08140 [Phycicoccus sp. Soil802]
MAALRGVVCRMLAIGAILAGVCVGVAGAASATPTIPGVPDCKDAPTAQLPGSGITGFLDEGPKTPPEPRDPFADHPSTSVYEQYGYAGLGWHTYDLGCGGGLRDVDASIDTATGNFLISTATWGAAATNGLHNKVAHPEEYMAPLDDVVAGVTQRLHDSIWSPWGATALVGVGALLLFYSMSGRLSSVTSAAAWALLVTAIVAGIGQYPTRVATFFDSTVTSSVSAISSGVSGLTNLPASSDPARAQGALVVDRVLYDNWLRGELGSTDSPAAKKWGPDLFKASAFTWAEARQAEQDPDAGKRIAEKKAENWKKTAAEIEKQDPVAYGYLQGKAGGRAGTGVMVALGSTFSLLFRLAADIFLFAGLVMLRFLVMLFPAIAVVGVMAPMASIVRRVFSMGGAAVVNVVAFSAGSAVHATIISAVLSRATTTGMGVLGIVLCMVATVAAFIVLFPLLSFTNILGHSGGPRWAKRGGREIWNYTSRRLATQHGVDAANEDADQNKKADGDEKAAAQDNGVHRRYRHTGLPAEAFGRPAYFPTVADSERALPAPQHLQLSSVEAPRPAHSVTANQDPVLAPDSAEADADREGPAYALAGEVQQTQPRPDPVNVRATSGETPISGRIVPQIPADAREIPNLAHDSHTQFRRDGIGPRLYDPDTKQTVLSLQKRAEE